MTAADSNMGGSQEDYAKQKSQTHKTTILFHLYLILEKEKYRDRKQISCCQELGKKKGTGYKDPRRKLHTFVKTHRTVHLKWANFITCQLQLNKVDYTHTHTYILTKAKDTHYIIQEDCLWGKEANGSGKESKREGRERARKREDRQ